MTLMDTSMVAQALINPKQDSKKPLIDPDVVAQQIVTDLLRKPVSKPNNKLAEISFLPEEFLALRFLFASINSRSGNGYPLIATELVKALGKRTKKHSVIYTLEKIERCYCEKTANCISDYISKCERGQKRAGEFKQLLSEIKHYEKHERADYSKKTEVDLAILHNGRALITDSKANDNHDSGKKPAIRRKALEVFASALHKLPEKMWPKAVPLIWYINGSRNRTEKFFDDDYVLFGSEFFEEIDAPELWDEFTTVVESVSKLLPNKLTDRIIDSL
jgi:hypothetical protein